MKTRKAFGLLLVITAGALGVISTVQAQHEVPTQERSPEAESLEKLREARDGLTAVGEYEAALEVGLKIVHALEEQPPAEMADDLLALAQIQAHLEDYEAAEANCLRVIGMREQEDGIFSPKLIAPFHALGRTYIDAGRYADAVVVLGRAQSISQRRYGLFNLEQIPLIDDMARAQTEMGDATAAHVLQTKRRDIAIRHFGAGAAELVPFYRHLGDYYYRHVEFYFGDWRGSDHARDQYEQALALSDASFGPSSPPSLDLLRRLVAVELYRKRRSEPSDRLAAALASDAPINAQERGLSLATLGDWSTINTDAASAERYYSEAYRALRESVDVDADALFAEPAALDFFPPPDEVDRARRFGSWDWGRIELAVDVSPSGQVTAVRTVSMEPRNADLEKQYKKQMLQAYFRPRLEQGQPVAASDVRYVNRFRYYERN